MSATSQFVAAAASIMSVGAPTAAEFQSLHVRRCEADGHNAARVRDARCVAVTKASVTYTCRYKLPEFGSGWKQYTAKVTRDDGSLVWLDGKTRCYDEPRFE